MNARWDGSEQDELRRRLLFGLTVAQLGALLLCAIVQWARGTLTTLVWYLVWSVDLVLGTLHQAVFWILFLCVATIIAGFSLLGGLNLSRPAPRRAPPYSGRTQRLACLFELAGQGQYYRWSLARELSLLLLDALGCDPGLESAQRRQWLNSAQLDIPPEIRAYVDSAMWSSFTEHAAHRPRLLRTLGRARTPLPLDLDPALVVRFLENQLEVANDRGLD
jgi:hypothetical protein